MEKQLHNLLINKNPDLEEIMKMCLDHQPFLNELVDNLTEKKETIRYNSVKILTRIAEERPEKIYPFWNVLKEQLYSINIYHILTAIILISRIIVADKDNNFNYIEDDYFNMINHKNVIPARYLILNIWRIGKARPEFISKIKDILFSLDRSHHKHIGLLKGDAILAFIELWDLMSEKDKAEVKSFVRKLTDSESPKTRKEARKFLEKYGG